jgi:hypothetical protein
LECENVSTIIGGVAFAIVLSQEATSAGLM